VAQRSCQSKTSGKFSTEQFSMPAQFRKLLTMVDALRAEITIAGTHDITMPEVRRTELEDSLSALVHEPPNYLTGRIDADSAEAIQAARARALRVISTI
jgi:hypothetical protein